MAKNHGASRQKKLAKQKAKRSEKRTDLARRSSNDPTIRLLRVADRPIVHALIAEEIWEIGMGSAAIARKESDGRLLYAAYLVDVYCLGVKDSFWDSVTTGEFEELVQKIETTQTLRPVDPACLAKIVNGAVEFARSFGFSPHPDFRHSGRLLEGIDSTTCPHEYVFGHDGKPLYIRGPNESLELARAIGRRVAEANGNYFIPISGPGTAEFDDLQIDDSDDEGE